MSQCVSYRGGSISSSSEHSTEVCACVSIVRLLERQGGKKQRHLAGNAELKHM